MQVQSKKYMKAGKIFFSFFILFAFLTKGYEFTIGNANISSRLATIQSLVEYRSFIIDNSNFIETIDKYFYRGHFYSDKPPVLALYGSFFYGILRNVFGLSLSDRTDITYYILTLIVIAITSCLGLVYLSKIFDYLEIEPNWSNLVVFLTGVGTLILPYSLVFNNHTVSGALLLFSLFSFWKIDKSIIHPRLAGFFLSLAGSIDITFFLFIPLAYIILWGKNLKIQTAFIFSCLPMIIIYLWLNYYTSGSLIPAAANKTLWDYPGSVFNENNLSGLAGSGSISELINYAFNLLIGSKGLFSYTPILGFSIFGLIKVIFGNRSKRHYLFIAIAALIFVFIYILRSNNYSGSSYGIRWFASLMFILCIPLGEIGENIKNSQLLTNLFIAVAAISIFISFIGVVHPFTMRTEAGYSSFLRCLEILKDYSTLEKLNIFFSMSVTYYVFYLLLRKAKLKLKLHP